MKEFESSIQEKDKMELSIQKKQQKEKELVGKIIPHKGHKVWEINTETLSIQLAEFEKQTFFIGQNHPNLEIIIRDGHAYVSAMNKSNALKKYKKGLNGSKQLENMPLKLF
jgi:hypothetical protein